MSQSTFSRLVGRCKQGLEALKAHGGQAKERLAGISRFVVLRRQLAEVSSAVAGLDRGERRKLAEILFGRDAATGRNPAFEISADSAPTMVKNGYQRLTADSRDVRLQGIAMWLRGALRETELSDNPELQELHRVLVKELRILREQTQPGAGKVGQQTA